MTYYGIVAQGRKWAEVRVNKTPGTPLTQEPTGVQYKSFRKGMDAVGQKNLEISRALFGR